MTLRERCTVIWWALCVLLSWRTLALWISVSLHKAGCADRYCYQVHVSYRTICAERARALLPDRVASIVEKVREQLRSGSIRPLYGDRDKMLSSIDNFLWERDEAKKRTLREKLGQDPDGVITEFKIPVCDRCGIEASREETLYTSWFCNDAVACEDRAKAQRPTLQ